MNNSRIKYLLTYINGLDERILSERAELKKYIDHSGLISNFAAHASKLDSLVAERTAICFTLSNLGFYVVYKDNDHAEKIICDDTGEEVAG